MRSPVGMEDVEVGVVAQESQVGNNPMKSSVIHGVPSVGSMG